MTRMTRGPERLISPCAALIVAATLALAIPPAVAAGDAIVAYKSLSPEVALEAAQAAM